MYAGGNARKPLNSADYNKITAVEKYAQYCSDASAIFIKMAFKTMEFIEFSYDNIHAGGLGEIEIAYLKQSADMRSSSVLLWMAAGTAHTEIAEENESQSD